MAEQEPSPTAELVALVEEALRLTRKARKHSKSLTGDNFYGNKLVKLRADATNAFADLSDGTVGKSSRHRKKKHALNRLLNFRQEQLFWKREVNWKKQQNLWHYGIKRFQTGR